MQFNLLIAMMTRTYEMIYATQQEWKRQVAAYYAKNLIAMCFSGPK